MKEVVGRIVVTLAAMVVLVIAADSLTNIATRNEQNLAITIVIMPFLILLGLFLLAALATPLLRSKRR